MKYIVVEVTEGDSSLGAKFVSAFNTKEQAKKVAREVENAREDETYDGSLLIQFLVIELGNNSDWLEWAEEFYGEQTFKKMLSILETNK